MISDILTIFSKLEDLLKLRQEHRKELFKLFVEPIYLDLTSIHEDYLKIFDAANLKLNNYIMDFITEKQEKKYSLADFCESPDATVEEITQQVKRILTIENKTLLEEIKAFFEEKQKQLAPLREKTIIICKELKKKTKSKRKNFPIAILQFVEEVVLYFFPRYHIDHIESKPRTRINLFITQADDLLSVMEEGDIPTYFSSNIFFKRLKDAQEEIKTSWSNVTIAYAKARTSCLS